MKTLKARVIAGFFCSFCTPLSVAIGLHQQAHLATKALIKNHGGKLKNIPDSLKNHRAQGDSYNNVIDGSVTWKPIQSFWFSTMAAGAIIGGSLTFSWGAFFLFATSTALVLLLGHSVGMHRKLIHNSFQCKQWLEYILVYCGVLVGLSGPLSLIRAHELRDYAQRLPKCHDYLCHRQPPLKDAWWQLHCQLQLRNPPQIFIEKKIKNDSFYIFLEKTWMLQQLPWGIAFFWLGGWSFVFWGVCARITAGVFGHWLIGYFAHNNGHMNYEVSNAAVQGRNIRFTSLLTMGECWHNNHHAFPGSAKLGLHPGEWDPGWWLLKALERMQLVWGLQMPVDLPFRSELKKIKPAHAIYFSAEISK